MESAHTWHSWTRGALGATFGRNRRKDSSAARPDVLRIYTPARLLWFQGVRYAERRMFHVLLRYRFRALWNSVRFSTPRQRVLGVVLWALALLLAAGVYVGFLVVTMLRGVGDAGVALTHEIALSVFLFMLAGSVPFLAATLLHPGDVELLGTMPVRVRHVVAVRLLEGALAGAVQFLPIGAPAVLASVVGMGTPPLRLPLLLIPGTLIVLLPACMTAVVLLLAVHWLGYGRVRSAIAAVNVLLGAVVCVVVVSQITGLRLQEGFHALVSSTANPSGRIAYLPPWSWFGEALHALASGDFVSFGRGTSLAVLATVTLGSLAIVLGERVWHAGSFAEGTGNAVHTSSAVTTSRACLRRLLPMPMAAVMAKEARYVFRDPLLLSQAGMPMILFLVPFVMAANPGFRVRAPGDELFAFAVLMVLAVLYMQSSIISASSVGLEGRAFWVYLVSPNQARTLVMSKWLTSWFLTGGAACGLIGLAAVAFGSDLPTVAILWLAVLGSAAGLCAIGVGVSSALPRFTFENPAHRVSPLAMIIGFGAGVAYSGLSWGTLGATWYGAIQWPQYQTPVTAAGVGFFLILTLAVVVVPLQLGIERLTWLEWEY